MKNFKDDLNVMVTDLHNSFDSKCSVLEDETVVTAHKKGEMNNVKTHIVSFELATMKAIYETSTVPNFKEYYDEIKQEIKKL